MVQYRWRIEIDPESLKEFVESQNKHQSVQFGYKVDHAVYVNYGTGPQGRFHSKYLKKPSPEVFRAIDEWARKKLSMYDEKERKRFVYLLVRKIWEHGMTPQPFWTVAWNMLSANLQRLYDRGYSLEDIGNEMKSLSNNQIMSMGIPYDGKIQGSWYGPDVISKEDAENQPTQDVRSLAEQVVRGW